ncbi:hypothetical protein D9M70_626120 [compost metagenome]
MLLVFRRDADTAVFHCCSQLHLLFADPADQQSDANLALLGKLDGITDEVGKDLLEAGWIDHHVVLGGQVQAQGQLQALLPRQAFEYPHHRLH